MFSPVHFITVLYLFILFGSSTYHGLCTASVTKGRGQGPGISPGYYVFGPELLS